MATAITGFGAEQLRLTPQPFQALSLGGNPPLPPAQPYGTPNQDLVPVQRASNAAVAANLTIAASPVYHQLLRLNQTVLGVTSPGTGAPPNSTAGVEAQNPAVSHQVYGGANVNSTVTTAQGPVSFSFTQAPATNTGYQVLQQTFALTPVAKDPPPSAPPSGDPPPASTTSQIADANTTSNKAPAPQSNTSNQAPVSQPVLQSTPSLPASSNPQYVLPANPSLIANIVQTVTQLAASAIYPAPVFSYSA
jgi:hypothetical protein